MTSRISGAWTMRRMIRPVTAVPLSSGDLHLPQVLREPRMPAQARQPAGVVHVDLHVLAQHEQRNVLLDDDPLTLGKERKTPVRVALTARPREQLANRRSLM